MAEACWYVVHTYSGYENKVKANIEKSVLNRKLENQILEVRVPTQEIVEIKNGKRRMVQRKMFPGYVFVHMINNDETWYVVRNTRGVTGFVGPESKPVPLTEEEMTHFGILDMEIDYEEGDRVRVTAEAWKDREGFVKSIDRINERVVVVMDLFEGETPIELGLTDVEKL